MPLKLLGGMHIPFVVEIQAQLTGILVKGIPI